MLATDPPEREAARPAQQRQKRRHLEWGQRGNTGLGNGGEAAATERKEAYVGCLEGYDAKGWDSENGKRGVPGRRGRTRQLGRMIGEG